MQLRKLTTLGTILLTISSMSFADPVGDDGPSNNLTKCKNILSISDIDKETPVYKKVHKEIKARLKKENIKLTKNNDLKKLDHILIANINQISTHKGDLNRTVLENELTLALFQVNKEAEFLDYPVKGNNIKELSPLAVIGDISLDYLDIFEEHHQFQTNSAKEWNRYVRQQNKLKKQMWKTMKIDLNISNENFDDVVESIKNSCKSKT